MQAGAKVGLEAGDPRLEAGDRSLETEKPEIGAIPTPLPEHGPLPFMGEGQGGGENKERVNGAVSLRGPSPVRPHRLASLRDARRESTGKPGSVGDSHSSWAHVTARLQRPTRGPARAAPRRAFARLAPLFGLAPGGVYPATSLARGAVRSYRTISPLPRTAAGRRRRYIFCGTFRGLASPRRYLAPCPTEPGLSSAPVEPWGLWQRGDCLVDSRGSSLCTPGLGCKPKCYPAL